MLQMFSTVTDEDFIAEVPGKDHSALVAMTLQYQWHECLCMCFSTTVEGRNGLSSIARKLVRVPRLRRTNGLSRAEKRTMIAVRRTNGLSRAEKRTMIAVDPRQGTRCC